MNDTATENLSASNGRIEDPIWGSRSRRWDLVIALLFIYIVFSYNRYRKLSHIKGPFLASFSGWWYSMIMLNGSSFQDIKRLSDKYGSLIRIGPNEVATSDPEMLNRMSGARSTYRRGIFYRAARAEVGKDHAFSMLDEKLHAKRRAQCASGYSGKENLLLQSTVDKHVLNLIALIRRKYISDSIVYNPVDFSHTAQYFTIDVITDIGCGRSFGDLLEDRDIHGYIQATEFGLRAGTFLGALGLTQLLQTEWIARSIMPSEKDAKGLGKLVAMIVEERTKPDAEIRPDMLESFRKRGLTQEELVSESILQIIAGSSTTSSALVGILLHVVSNSTAYNALRKEIDEAIKADWVSRPVIQEAEFKSLPYLNAIIKESMRLFSPVISPLTKTVPPEGDTIEADGKSVFLPGGTNVIVAWGGLMLSKELFSPDPDIFRPERWLEAPVEKLALMNRTFDLNFGHGRYQCMGKTIALSELHKVLFALFERFDITLVNQKKPWTTTNLRSGWVVRDLWLRIAERGDAAE